MKNKKKTPYEEWIGRKPLLSYLHTWGCLTSIRGMDWEKTFTILLAHMGLSDQG
jgi:hypothetical protein